MWEVCSIQIAYDTPLEVLEEINVRVKQYLIENNREWGGGHQVNINNITNMVRSLFFSHPFVRARLVLGRRADSPDFFAELHLPRHRDRAQVELARLGSQVDEGKFKSLGPFIASVARKKLTLAPPFTPALRSQRTIFLKHLKNVLHELEVTYQLPVQPVMLPAGSENMQSFANSAFSPSPSEAGSPLLTLVASVGC